MNIEFDEAINKAMTMRQHKINELHEEIEMFTRELEDREIKLERMLNTPDHSFFQEECEEE